MPGFVVLAVCRDDVLVGVMRLTDCLFDGAGCLVCDLCRLTVVWVGCRRSVLFSLAVPSYCSFVRVTQSRFAQIPCVGMRASDGGCDMLMVAFTHAVMTSVKSLQRR